MEKSLFQLILASQSPRRKELLNHLGVHFKIEPADIDEDIEFNSPQEMVEQLALEKANKVFHSQKNNSIVIGSDTTVAMNDRVYNKPKNFEEALSFLQDFSAKSHDVLSGVAIVGHNLQKVFSVKTKVYFKELTLTDIEKYLSFNEYQDKAGAYGIQGAAGAFVTKLEGSYSNVVGLPQVELISFFEEHFGKDWREYFV